MRALQGILSVFLFGVFFVLFLLGILTSVYAFITWDLSCFKAVWDSIDPTVHMWSRIVITVWACISLFIGSIFGQLG